MNKSRKWIIYFCTAILICLMLSIFVRLFTRLVLVKRMGMENKFTSIVLFDNAELQKYNQETVASEIDWGKIYPFNSNDTYVENLENIKTIGNSIGSKLENIFTALTTKINNYTSGFLVGHDECVKLHKVYQSLLGWNVKYAGDGLIDVIHMKNGYLTYIQEKISDEDIEEIADSVADFDTFLKEKGIDFYYINAGSKVNPDDKQLSDLSLLNENTNENADKLLSELDVRGINYVDMRQLMKDDNLDWYGSYYITDHHWTTRTGLWCASKIASILNEKSGFEYDMKLFDEASYNITTYDNFWYGGQAIALQLVGCEKENFDLIIPDFDTDFEVCVPTLNYSKTGDYRETIIDSELYDEIEEYEDKDFLSKNGPYYTAYRNSALATIKNNMTQDNVNSKILIIEDSFGWYSSSFLACDTGEVDLICAGAFNGSIREYINQTEPDVVILMYCERNIKSIDWSTHKATFDLR